MTGHLRLLLLFLSKTNYTEKNDMDEKKKARNYIFRT